MQKLVHSFNTHSLSIIYVPGPTCKAGEAEMNKTQSAWESSQQRETAIIIIHYMWLGFPCPTPTSSPRNLDFNSQRTILWGEKKKKKEKMTTVNPVKVAGLSRNIATL